MKSVLTTIAGLFFFISCAQTQNDKIKIPVAEKRGRLLKKPLPHLRRDVSGMQKLFFRVWQVSGMQYRAMPVGTAATPVMNLLFPEKPGMQKRYRFIMTRR